MAKAGLRKAFPFGLAEASLPGVDLARAFSERWIRRGIIAGFGVGFTLPYFRLLNQIHIEGEELLGRLPRRNVVFLSNHQTYFLEAIAFFDLVYVRLQMPFERPLLRFSAAEETMRRNLLTVVMRLAGGVTFRRSFRDGGAEVSRPVDLDGVGRVKEAIQNGWLLHFPAGTTKPGAPLRSGVARILHNTRAIAVPVRVDGFRRLLLKGQLPGKLLKECSIQIHPPIDLSGFYGETYTKAGGERVLHELEERIGDIAAEG